MMVYAELISLEPALFGGDLIKCHGEGRKKGERAKVLEVLEEDVLV